MGSHPLVTGALLCLLTSCAGIAIVDPVGGGPGAARHEGPGARVTTPAVDALGSPLRPVLDLGAGSDDLVLDPESGALLRQKQYSQEVSGSLLFYLGKRWYEDEKFWNPLDEPYMAGVELAWNFRTMLPVELEMGFLYAKEEGEDPPTMIQEDLHSYEAYLGIRQTWELDWYSMWPYLGAGVSYQYCEANLATVLGPKHMGDGSFGLYAHTGFYVLIGTTLVAGLDLRGVFGQSLDLEKDGISYPTRAGYLQAAFSAGFAW
ncbi:MAG: hypothetical protein R3F30_06690 [Planctomycetota bacterium]